MDLRNSGAKLSVSDNSFIYSNGDKKETGTWYVLKSESDHVEYIFEGEYRTYNGYIDNSKKKILYLESTMYLDEKTVDFYLEFKKR